MKKKDTLTEKQQHVLELIANGFNDKEIAKTLGCTEANVRNISTNIFYKIDAYNRPNLVYKAMKKGLIQ